MEEILREAFKEGQQWVQDANVGKVPVSFNEWFKSEKTQALILHNVIVVIRNITCNKQETVSTQTAIKIAVLEEYF